MRVPKWVLACGWAMAGVLTPAATSQAAVLIYDDGYGTGWSGEQWDMTTNNTNTRNGSESALSAKTGGGAATKVAVQHSGLNVGSDSILEFWINTDNNAQSGQLLVKIKFNSMTDAVGFDDRNGSRDYYVDGTKQSYGANLKSDADSSSWQRVQLDLTQTNYPGWPYVLTTFNPATDQLKYISIETSSANLLVDDISLVPEPAALGLLGLPALFALRRSRRGC